MRCQGTGARCHLLQARDGSNDGREETGLVPSDSSTGPVDEQWAAMCGDEPGYGAMSGAWDKEPQCALVNYSMG